MTVEEAFRIQKKELNSLKAENRRLKKQLENLSAEAFPIEEKRKLTARIHYLERQLAQSESRYQTSRKHWVQAENLQRDLEFEAVEMKRTITSLTSQLEEMTARAKRAEDEVAVLNGTKLNLEKKLSTNFLNSSLPSSALPFRPKVANSRKPSGKKPGAQPKHQPHTAAKLTPTKEPVILSAPEEFLSNPDIYPTGKTITKQLIDVSVVVSVQEFIAEEFRSRSTGIRCHAPFPAGVVNTVNYGPSVKALAFLLNNYYNVPVNKTRQCILDLTNGIVNLSTGTICNLCSYFSAATEDERAKIFSRLSRAGILYSDATVSNINGKRKAVILCTNKEDVLYQHFDHKGHDSLAKTPVNNSGGTIVHDHDRSYYAYGSNHQECLAHVLRYLVSAMENEPDLTWHSKMHDVIQKMIHASKKHSDSIPKAERLQLIDEYQRILALADKEYTEHPPSKYYRDGFCLQKRLREYQQHHLYFLTHPGVDYTNNISERELRKFKRKQKQAVVLRSDSGAQHICDALTVIESARMQNRNVYDVVKNAFAR